ncbi:MAG: phosphoribosylformylglycinamidine cyclo-ligase [Phycisphaerales bacterium]|nr:phosphoribosylformylglycinamidine cyclo-ligase [Phycisphaerales bacterium]
MPSPASKDAKPPKPQGLTYAGSGVSIHEGDRFVDLIMRHMRSTHSPRVLANEGGFAGLFRLDFNQQLFKRNFKEPVLIACTDGVGTKIKLAVETDRFEGIGQDLVAMNVNDLVVQGGEPLLFLDYIACGRLVPERLERIVRSIADACRACETALLGGETAEMPDVYGPDDLDLAGFAVGVVELKRATDPTRVEPGDIVLGLASSGVHSNGYSLVRKIIKHAGLDLARAYAELAPPGHAGPPPTLADVLLTPTRLYAPSVVKLARGYKVKKVVTGMAHITGSGLAGNLERALHPDVDALIDESAWTPPPVFPFLQQHGSVDDEEMRNVFNMGVGYCLICRPTFAASIKDRLRKLGEQVFVMGKVVKGKGQVRIKPR